MSCVLYQSDLEKKYHSCLLVFEFLVDKYIKLVHKLRPNALIIFICFLKNDYKVIYIYNIFKMFFC